MYDSYYAARSSELPAPRITISRVFAKLCADVYPFVDFAPASYSSNRDYSDFCLAERANHDRGIYVRFPG